jgi:hypothetical protein
VAEEVISGPVGDDGVRLPFKVDDVPWEEYTHGTRFGTRVRQLGEYGGCSHVGVCLEEVAPGRQTYVAHYHYLEEEQLLVLEDHPPCVSVRRGSRWSPAVTSCSLPARRSATPCSTRPASRSATDHRRAQPQ